MRGSGTYVHRVDRSEDYLSSGYQETVFRPRPLGISESSVCPVGLNTRLNGGVCLIWLYNPAITAGGGYVVGCAEDELRRARGRKFETLSRHVPDSNANLEIRRT